MHAINQNYSINPLVIAVFEHAVREALKGDKPSRRWLYSEGVLWIDAVLDIHPDHTRQYLDRIFNHRTKQTNLSQAQTAQPKGVCKLERLSADPASVFA
jgi:hypothetical protein